MEEKNKAENKNQIDLQILIKNGVHFGHQTSKWSPKMEPYIWGSKNNIHLLNVATTARLLEIAGNFLESVAAEGKTILWVGTKKAAQEIIERAGKELNLPYVVHRWVGGTFSNYRQVRKSVANLLHYEDILAASAQSNYTKKELGTLQKKLDRLKKNVGGITQLGWPIGAVVVVDVKKEHVCIKEASATGIPVIALVDTNSDPSDVQYVIPGNDDAPRAIEIIVNYLVDSTKKGQAVAKVNRDEAALRQVTLETRKEKGSDILDEDEESADKKGRSAGKPKATKKPQASQARRTPRAGVGGRRPASDKAAGKAKDS